MHPAIINWLSIIMSLLSNANTFVAAGIRECFSIFFEKKSEYGYVITSG